jgi:hypothetical protein
MTTTDPTTPMFERFDIRMRDADRTPPTAADRVLLLARHREQTTDVEAERQPDGTLTDAGQALSEARDHLANRLTAATHRPADPAASPFPQPPTDGSLLPDDLE